MRSTRLLPIVGCGALATLTFLALCAGGALLGLAWNVRASADAVSAPPVRTTTVAMRNDRFIPAHIEVSPGTTVTWHNDDAQRHNVVFRNSGPAASPLIGRGEEYRATFDAVGTFDYVCTLHSGMVGRVTVTPPAP